METNITEKMKPSAERQVSDIQPASESLNQTVFLPIALLMVSVILVLGWNLYVSRQQRVGWEKQLVQRDPLVVQSRSVQSDLQRILNNLLLLSAGDADAKAIIDKYQIKQQPESASGEKKR